jgi:hypothetical protein
MERRDLLKRGMLLGATVVTDRVAPALAEPEGDGAPVSFFEGVIEGEDFPGWSLAFSVAGRRAQGFAFDPATVDGQLRGLRFEGRARERELLMQVFGLEDVNHLRPLGQLGGAVEQGVLAGTMVLPARDFALARFRAWGVPVSPGASQRLVGTYQAAGQDPGGTPLYAGVLFIQPGYRWELRHLRAAPGLPTLAGEAGQRLAGRYAVAADGRLLLSMTRVPVRLRQPRSPVAAAVDRQRRPSAAAPAAAPRLRPAAGGRGRVAAGPVTFTDDTFAAGDWSATKVADTSPDSAGTFQAEQVAAGGNPGAFRRTTLSWFNFGAGFAHVDVAHLRDQFVHDPATDGAIGSLSFTYDLINFGEPGEPGECRYFPLVRQGNGYYITADFDRPPAGGWQSFARAAVTAAGFHLQAGMGPERPDFSSTGAPLRFGYYSLGTILEGEAHCVTGLDNYSVTLTPEAIFRSLALTGTDEPGVGVAAEYVAMVTDAAGQPAPGEQVLFEMQLEGVPVGEETVPTDASGQARFRFTFGGETARQGFTLTACLDENRNGDCDPTEQREEITGVVSAVSVSLSGPSSAGLLNQVCYQARLSGASDPGQHVLLMSEGSDTPLAQGETNGSDQVQLCFTTPPEAATMTLTACWDVNRDGDCDEGEPRSNSLELAVAPPPPVADIPCDECCLSILLTAIQNPRGQAAAMFPGRQQIVIEHPFTHLLAVLTRVR